MYYLSTSRGVVSLVVNRWELAPGECPDADPKTIAQVRSSLALSFPRSRWGPPQVFRPERSSLLSDEGFAFERGASVHQGIRVSGIAISVPFWFIASLFMLPPSLWLLGQYRRSLRSANLAQSTIVLGTGGRPALTRRLPTVAAAILLLLCLAILIAVRLTEPSGRTALFTRKGVLYELTLQNGSLLIVRVEEWPGSQSLRIMERPDGNWPVYPFRDFGVHITGGRSVLGFAHFSGHVQMMLELDGSVMLLPYGRDAYNFKLSSGMPFQEFVLSLRTLALAAAILPVTWIIAFARYRLRRRIALRHGLCTTCGYNLAGNTTGICPECGASPGHTLKAQTQAPISS